MWLKKDNFQGAFLRSSGVRIPSQAACRNPDARPLRSRLLRRTRTFGIKRNIVVRNTMNYRDSGAVSKYVVFGAFAIRPHKEPRPLLGNGSTYSLPSRRTLRNSHRKGLGLCRKSSACKLAVRIKCPRLTEVRAENFKRPEYREKKTTRVSATSSILLLADKTVLPQKEGERGVQALFACQCTVFITLCANLTER